MLTDPLDISLPTQRVVSVDDYHETLQAHLKANMDLFDLKFPDVYVDREGNMIMKKMSSDDIFSSKLDS